MPKKTFDAKKEAIRYLQSQILGVIATVSFDGMPEAATVYFWVNDVEKDVFNFYILTRRHTRKFQNLLRNKRVAMVVGTELAPSSIQVSGDAEIIDVDDHIGHMKELVSRLKKHPAVAMLYAGSFFPRNPFSKLGDDFALLRVTPTWVRWMHFDKDTKNVVYHQIIGDGGSDESKKA
jgi:general stress protein 26